MRKGLRLVAVAQASCHRWRRSCWRASARCTGNDLWHCETGLRAGLLGATVALLVFGAYLCRVLVSLRMRVAKWWGGNLGGCGSKYSGIQFLILSLRPLMVAQVLCFPNSDAPGGLVHNNVLSANGRRKKKKRNSLKHFHQGSFIMHVRPDSFFASSKRLIP